MYEESVKMLASRLKLRNTSILVTGATGLIGSCVIDVLAKANDEYGANIKIYALSRSKNKIEKDFGTRVFPVVQDIVDSLDDTIEYDWIIHGASNADPKMYAVQPVETILTNIIGTKNVLDYCREHRKT